MAKLKNQVIEQISKDRVLFKMIEDELELWDSRTLRRYLSKNKRNGPLTSYGILIMVSTFLGVDMLDLITVDNPRQRATK